MKIHQSVLISSVIAIISAFFVSVTGTFAAEFTLAWDPHENTHSNLSGYNLYYKAHSSVHADPDGAYLVYIPLSEPGFDLDYPRYTVTDLLDNTQYFFTVTAMVGDEESGMSNEVSAINSASTLETSLGTQSAATSAGSSGGGCFISTLK